MKTIEINLYSFDELSEEARQKALESLYDINVDYDWWGYVYEDAERVGLKITGFDIDRGSYCNIDVISSHTEVADLIIKEHGEMCKTFKTAKNFLKERDSLVAKFSDGVKTDKVTYENEYEFDNECDELENEFLYSLCEDYRIMLSQEYEYKTSKEAIIETIKTNEYTFEENGKLRNS